MFIGHYAPALIAAVHPKAPKLGILFVAAQLVDIGFFTLALLGVEHMRVTPGITAMNPMDLYDMPYTHSLVGTLCWAAAMATVIIVLGRGKAGTAIAAIITALVVASHWLLDLLVHRPDLTIAGQPPKLGLGLWNHPMIEMPLEIGLIALGFLIYIRQTRPINRRSPVPMALIVSSLLAMQAVNWFGPEPEAFAPGIAISALIAYAVLAGLAHWLASSRVRKTASSPG